MYPTSEEEPQDSKVKVDNLVDNGLDHSSVLEEDSDEDMILGLEVQRETDQREEEPEDQPLVHPVSSPLVPDPVPSSDEQPQASHSYALGWVQQLDNETESPALVSESTSIQSSRLPLHFMAQHSISFPKVFTSHGASPKTSSYHTQQLVSTSSSGEKSLLREKLQQKSSKSKSPLSKTSTTQPSPRRPPVPTKPRSCQFFFREYARLVLPELKTASIDQLEHFVAVNWKFQKPEIQQAMENRAAEDKRRYNRELGRVRRWENTHRNLLAQQQAQAATSSGSDKPLRITPTTTTTSSTTAAAMLMSKVMNNAPIARAPVVTMTPVVASSNTPAQAPSFNQETPSLKQAP